jgi:hypothetical protein
MRDVWILKNPHQVMYSNSQVELYHGVAPSRVSLHAEFVACFEAAWQLLWLKKFVPGLRVLDIIERPLKIYYNNKAAVLYAHNNKKTKVAKHINIRFYVVKEKIQDQTIRLEHISTKKMITNPFTKDLPPNVFREHLAGMGSRESL